MIPRLGHETVRREQRMRYDDADQTGTGTTNPDTWPQRLTTLEKHAIDQRPEALPAVSRLSILCKGRHRAVVDVSNAERDASVIVALHGTRSMMRGYRCRASLRACLQPTATTSRR